MIPFQYHQEYSPLGIETVGNNLRLKYWILNIRAAVKKCFNNCQLCRKRKCKPQPPEMGISPTERLEIFTFPFSFVHHIWVEYESGWEFSSKKQWSITQALANSYWRRWIRKYRPTPIQRQKWYDKTYPIKVRDIVLVADEKAPRNHMYVEMVSYGLSK
ncbi:hypothetical protein JTB14_037147 [Gonioctena quinquepunctata]|nr:hypothetical protein JTB14_037147 [Gonioctena quinquepunctata]